MPILTGTTTIKSVLFEERKQANGDKTLIARQTFLKATCDDAAAATAKSIEIDGWEPAEGDSVAITYTNGNTAASVTLSVNGESGVTVKDALGGGDARVAVGGTGHYRFTGSYWALLDGVAEVGETYSEMTTSDYSTGTSTEGMVISPATLKTIGTSLLTEAAASAVTYKGTVANYAALPTSGQVWGDMYKLLDTSEEYFWDGTAWEPFHLSPTIPNAAVCSTAANAYAKQVTMSGFTLTDKCVIIVTFTNGNIYSNTGTPLTLSVNGGAAKTLNLRAGLEIAAGSTLQLLYNATAGTFTEITNTHYNEVYIGDAEPSDWISGDVWYKTEV